MMQFIKEFIKRKENEIISQSNNAVKILDKDWKNFLKNDTYLIYDDKSNLLKKKINCCASLSRR